MGVLGYTKDRSKDSKPEGLPISCFAICSQLPSTRYTDINRDGTTVVAYNHYDLERGDGLMNGAFQYSVCKARFKTKRDSLSCPCTRDLSKTEGPLRSSFW